MVMLASWKRPSATYAGNAAPRRNLSVMSAWRERSSFCAGRGQAVLASRGQPGIAFAVRRVRARRRPAVDALRLAN
jgi:hypothetical protein